MHRNFAIALVLAAAASSSFADDITIDKTPLTSTATRAEVQAELNAFRQSRVNPWSNQYNPLVQFSSKRTRADVAVEYIAAREQVAALNGEDSGSAYLAHHQDDAAVAATIAGQPRNAQ